VRIYTDFAESSSEIRRDLAEMGEVRGETKYVSNLIYAVMRPDYTEVPDVHEEWVEQEWEDRVRGNLNPGKAWKKWPEVWAPRLEKDRGHGKTSYVSLFYTTHSKRIGGRHLQTFIENLRQYPQESHFLPVWSPVDELHADRLRPTDLGYLGSILGETVELTYLSRQMHFGQEYASQVALAVMMQWYITQKLDLSVGMFYHFIADLWATQEELADVF
jgi:thymidylate synthase